jgi:hypothetical protein
MDDWEMPEERLKGAPKILRSLVTIAEKGKKGGVAHERALASGRCVDLCIALQS